jgi:hypothetical protein
MRVTFLSVVQYKEHPQLYYSFPFISMSRDISGKKNYFRELIKFIRYEREFNSCLGA